MSDGAAEEMFDADGALSRAFLLRRGTCCGYRCKNCPYDHIAVISEAGMETSAKIKPCES